MDPADPVKKAVSFQGALLGQHEQLFQALYDSNQHMASQVVELSRHMAQLASLIVPQLAQQAVASKPHIAEAQTASPEPFDGTHSKCRGFLLQCSMVFRQHPLSFCSDQAKVFTFGLLRGKALPWAEALNASTSISALS